MGEDDLVELLWKRGHVVETSQAQRPPAHPPPVFRGSGSGGGGEESAPLQHPTPLLQSQQQQPSDDQNLFLGEDEMASWLHHHHPPLLRQEDEFFYSGLFSTPFTQPQGSISLTPPLPLLPPLQLPPPPPPAERPMDQVIAARRAENFINFSRLRGNIYTGRRVGAAAAPWVQLVQDSTQVGSNATPSSWAAATESCLPPAGVTSGFLHTFAVPSLTQMAGPSSSVVSRTQTELFQIQPVTETEAAADDERKRKEIEPPADDTQETGEEEARGSNSRKRSRATELHNISEKKRREKINEKMKTLQELIPRCNKTDRASMLDDAIEYVKALQLQIQMISTGGGGMMPPMMYNPNMPRFMPPSAMGMNRPPFMPFPGLAPPYPSPPRYPFPNVQAFDPSSVHIPTQQPDRNQPPPFPGYYNPYSQFVGLQQPAPTQLQNQTTSQVSFSQASSSKEPEGHGKKPIG